MKRTILTLALIALAAFGLSACTTTPASPAPAAAPAKTIVEMEFELRKLELDAEKTTTMSLVKFAADSDSDFAKGVVSGLLGSKFSGNSAGQGSRPSIMQAQAQQEEIALRRYALEQQNGFWNRGLQVLDRGLAFAQFSRGLGFQKFQIEQSNAQSRYTTDALRGTQQDGYEFNSRVPYYFSLPMGSQSVTPAAMPVATE